MQKIRLLDTEQLAAVLGVNEHAIDMLVDTNQIPCTYIRQSANCQSPRFNPRSIADWLGQKPTFESMHREPYLDRLKQRYKMQFPSVLRKLEVFSSQFTAKRKSNGYSLSKVPNKKLGFVYYVRYIVDGKLVPSRWTTRTNNFDLATDFAIANRNRLLAEYQKKRPQRKTSSDLYHIMQTYYAKNSPLLQVAAQRGRVLAENTRRVYHNSILNKWIPYLRANGIQTFLEIDTPLVVRYQNHLLSTGMKPQTIGHDISFVSQIFDHMLLEGYVMSNPCRGLVTLKTTEDSFTIRGCYDVHALRGVFNTRWQDQTLYLLCLLIYTTGMRNSEIERVQMHDLIMLGKCRFIDIPKSKTKNGVRIVPLHDFVYRKLMRYANKLGKKSYDYIIGRVNRRLYTEANAALGALAGYDTERLAAENITFYSGRHFWKTLMNSDGLGDVEEYFMGHRVSNDVAKRYNHRDRQGKKMVVRKAKEMFAILDKRVFKLTSRP